MNTEALKWYRENSNFTENSRQTGKEPILYFNAQVNTGGRYIYPDNMRAPYNFYGTPAEFGSKTGKAKYISVVSSADKGKIMYTNYESSPKLTTKTVFPGVQNNGNGNSDASPYHMIKLYFAGRSSLRLNMDTKSAGYKTWS